MSVISDLIRKQFGDADDLRDGGVADPPGVTRVDDVAYGPDARWQSLDVYRPEGSVGPLPVIVSVHGGGWVYGDKERYHLYCMDLARRGFAVVNFTYRLAPEFTFPASLEDTCAVFAWTLSHADAHGLDTAHVFAVGDSAGAHMLGLFCDMCVDAAYAAELGFAPPAGFVPTAVALNCGAYEIVVTDDPNDLTTALMADYLPDGGTRHELDLVSVVSHANGAFPPAYLMTSDGDFLRKDLPVLDARLSELGVMHETHVFAGLGEPLGHVFHLNMRSADAARVNDDECAFFRRFL